MSAEAVDAALAALALERGRSVRRAGVGHLRVAEMPLVLSVVGMAGEPSAVWGVNVGHLVGRGETIIEGDPRRYGDAVALWSRLGAQIARWRSKLVALGHVPQVLVANAAAVELLDAACVRFHNDERHPDARLAAETLRFVLDRADLAGQQSLVVATRLLDEHFAAGSADAAGRLGVALGWASGFDDLGTQLAAARAGGNGVVLDPTVDLGVLAAPVRDYNRYADAGSPAARAKATAVGGPLAKALAAQRSQILAALGHYQAAFPEHAGVVDELWESEATAFGRFITRRARGMRLARRDSTARSVVGLVERTERAEYVATRLVWADPVAWVRALATGDAVEGRAIDAATVAVTGEGRLRLRRGAPVWVHDGERRGATVTSVARTDGGYEIGVALEADGALTPGGAVRIGPAGRSGGEVGRRVAAAAQRTSQLGWTHDPDHPVPPGRGGNVPSDLAERVERARGERGGSDA